MVRKRRYQATFLLVPDSFKLTLPSTSLVHIYVYKYEFVPNVSEIRFNSREKANIWLTPMVDVGLKATLMFMISPLEIPP